MLAGFVIIYFSLLVIFTSVLVVFWRKLFLKQAEMNKQVKVNNEQLIYALVGDKLSDLILLINEQGETVYASSSHKRLLHYMPTIGIQVRTYMRIKEEDYNKLYALKLEESCTMEVQIANQRGEWLWLETTVFPMKADAPAPFVAHLLFVSREITERKQYEERLYQLAYYDRLTSVPNRSQFTLALVKKLQDEDRSFALIMIDCDRFQQLNDSLGHQAGDAYLLKVSRALTELVGQAGQVFRVGGDEFAIMTHNGDTESQNRLLEQLTLLFRKPWTIAEQHIYTSVSIGVARYPEHGEDLEKLMRSVDAALHRSKLLGGNQVTYFDKHLLDLAIRRAILENDLNTAQARQELSLVYQPQISLASGELTGVESLVRWEHRLLGMISPAEFIPVAEATGLIVPIGKWIMLEACAQNKAWLEQGYRWVVSVNISSRQLHHPAFVEDVMHVLEASELPPVLLKLEITEGMLMKYKEETLLKLKALKQLGVGIAVDDFGTGYSSLAYLKRFPIDTIKIDRSFVQGLPGDAGDVSIVNAIIRLCHSLQMDLVAEGTETLQQLICLHDLACDAVQGYYFGKPVQGGEMLGHLPEIRRLAEGFRKQVQDQFSDWRL